MGRRAVAFSVIFALCCAGALAQSATQTTQAQTATNEAIAELAVASVDATAAAAAPALAVAAAAETTSAAAANAAAASVPAEPRVIEVVTAEPQLAVSEVSAPATLEISATPAAVASAAAATETVPAAAAAAATTETLTNEGPPPQDLSLPLTYYEWSGLYVKRTPDGRAYVHFNQDGVSSPKDAVTVSEAVGFGMLASVLAGPKYDFDAFLKMYESFANARSGMMGWEIVERGGVLKFNDDLNANGNDSATDGDMDAAVALILAGERFSDPTYTAKGRAVGARLQQWTLNPESGLPNLGDWVARAPGIAQDRGFGPKFFYYVSRPSDFSQAAMFSILEKGGAGDPAKWKRAREQGLTALDTLLNETPLPPDFAIWDPTAKRIVRPQSGVTLLEKYTDSDFSWNACRVPWRLAARLVEDPTDQKARAVAQKLASFYQSRSKLNAGYRLPTLEPLVDYEAVAFSAPAWALLKALGDPKASQYEADVRRLRNYGGLAKGYYGDSTLLLAGLQLTKPFWRK